MIHVKISVPQEVSVEGLRRIAMIGREGREIAGVVAMLSLHCKREALGATDLELAVRIGCDAGTVRQALIVGPHLGLRVDDRTLGPKEFEILKVIVNSKEPIANDAIGRAVFVPTDHSIIARRLALLVEHGLIAHPEGFKIRWVPTAAGLEICLPEPVRSANGL